jgi:hypothetical protein
MPDVTTADGIGGGNGNGIGIGGYNYCPRSPEGFDTTYNRRDHGVASALSLSLPLFCKYRVSTLQVYYHGTALAARIGFGNNNNYGCAPV